MAIVGSGNYIYEHIESWAKLPSGMTFGDTSAVSTDSQDRVFVFQRKGPSGADFRPGRQLPGLVGRQRHYRSPRAVHLRRCYLPDRPCGLGGVEIYAGRQGVAGHWHPRRPLGHGLRKHGGLGPPRRRALQLPHRNGACSVRRPVRDRRVPQQPGASLLRRRQTHPFLGRAGQDGRRSLPSTPQRFD